MAPLRRYLRITKYSVLECRIYLDNPALAHSWLLNPRDPVLPRVIEAIRPFVLPKLREERERSRRKSTKKRGIKDTVAQDDFEVAIFLTETSTRHSLLYKHKHFRDTTQTKLTSNSSKLTGASQDTPIDVDNPAATEVPASAIRDDGSTPVRVLHEDDDAEVVPLHDIPSVQDRDDRNAAVGPSASQPPIRPSRKRRRRTTSGTGPAIIRNTRDGVELDGSAQNLSQGAGPTSANMDMPVVVSDDDEDGDKNDDDLFVSDNSESDDDADSPTAPPQGKRREGAALAPEAEPEEAHQDDKKKLALDISYEGFSIYGRVLCLVVKRRDGYVAGKGKGKAVATGAATTATRGARPGQSAGPGGQAVMENWITSTQLPADATSTAE